MATLEISNRTLRFGNRTLNLRTVTTITKLQGKTPRPFSIKHIFYAALAVGASILIATSSDYRTIGVWVALITGAFLVFAIVRNSKPRDFWLLHVETAAASNNLLASRDERSINEAVSRITEALESDVAYSSTVHIADSTIVNDSVISNSNVTNTSAKK
jgi:hypothetical protein